MAGRRVHLDTVALHFSTRCAAACPFCYFAKREPARQVPTPLHEIEAILTKLAADDVREVLFFGGDPIAHPHSIQSLELASRLGFEITVLRNSWAIRPIDEFARAVSLINHCEATLLGLGAENHDRLTHHPGS
jgi:MoaA/NifB/PqqE/SkfB family radical SAM enzyme